MPRRRIAFVAFMLMMPLLACTAEKKTTPAAAIKPPTSYEGIIVKRKFPLERASSLPGKNEHYILKTKDDLHIPLNPVISLMFPNLQSLLYRLVRVRGAYKSYPAGEFTVHEITPLHDDSKSVP